MDNRLFKAFAEILRVAMVLVPGILYFERRFTAIEMRAELQSRVSEMHSTRLDKAELDTRSRVAIGIDGGFAEPAIRSAVERTVESTTKRIGLETVEHFSRAMGEIEGRIQALIARISQIETQQKSNR